MKIAGLYALLFVLVFVVVRLISMWQHSEERAGKFAEIITSCANGVGYNLDTTTVLCFPAHVEELKPTKRR